MGRDGSARRAGWLRSPLLHFLVLGSLLFGARQLLWGRPEAAPPAPVVVTAAEVAAIAEGWRARTGRPPSEAELEGLIAGRVDEELLVRTARSLGFHRTDPVVQQRLLRNLRFLDDPEGGGAAIPASRDPDAELELLERALALGLDESDPVVRRRLAERMRQIAIAPARAAEPSEAELAAVAERRPELVAAQPRVRLSHVFLSRDRRGDRTRADADALLERLRGEGLSPAAALSAGLGDPLLVAAQLPLLTEARLSARLGPDFAAAALRVEPGRWSGPLSSSYGEHLVWVHERDEVRPPASGLRAAWLAEREREALRSALASLRSQTRVEIQR